MRSTKTAKSTSLIETFKSCCGGSASEHQAVKTAKSIITYEGRILSTIGTSDFPIRGVISRNLTLFGTGAAMAKTIYQYFDANPGIGKIGQANHAIRGVDYENSDRLRYSSPWPWIFALGISLAMWASLGWIIWIFTR
jgi:hypothetical protein